MIIILKAADYQPGGQDEIILYSYYYGSPEKILSSEFRQQTVRCVCVCVFIM